MDNELLIVLQQQLDYARFMNTSSAMIPCDIVVQVIEALRGQR